MLVPRFATITTTRFRARAKRQSRNVSLSVTTSKQRINSKAWPISSSYWKLTEELRISIIDMVE